jgi:hypothetical protein
MVTVSRWLKKHLLKVVDSWDFEGNRPWTWQEYWSSSLRWLFTVYLPAVETTWNHVTIDIFNLFLVGGEPDDTIVETTDIWNRALKSLHSSVFNTNSSIALDYRHMNGVFTNYRYTLHLKLIIIGGRGKDINKSHRHVTYTTRNCIKKIKNNKHTQMGRGQMRVFCNCHYFVLRSIL